jgi:SAM-dependent methyltransferase
MISLRYYEIAEASHRILNPLSDDKLMVLGELCRLRPAQRHLDLACGKGEMLCRWAQHHDTHGIGVDVNDLVLTAARARADELGVAGQVRFEKADAGDYHTVERFDVVSCLGATWIGDGLVGTIELMRQAVSSRGLLLVGEPYWVSEPPFDAYKARGCEPDEFTSLEGMLDRLDHAGVELIEMVLANQDDWDRYMATQWSAICDWLRTHHTAPDAPDLHTLLNESRRGYLTYLRKFLGWGVFVLRTIETRETKGSCTVPKLDA